MKSIQIAGISRQKTQQDAPALKSIEGYVLIVTNLHPETTEDMIYDTFDDFSRVSNVCLNLDRHTGFVKGYALVQFSSLDDAMEIINVHNKEEKFELLGNVLDIDYAFVDLKECKKKSNRKSKFPDDAKKRLSTKIGKRDLSPTR